MSMAQLGEVLVLEDANEPGHQGSLSIIASQDRQGTLAFSRQQIAPELGDGLLLAFGIARKQPHRSQTQGIDEQTIGAVGPRREQDLPGARMPLQAGAGQKPV